MSGEGWPSIGDVIVFWDRPEPPATKRRTGAAGRTWKAKVLESPASGSDRLVVDLGGGHGWADFDRNFNSLYVWQRAEADELLEEIRKRVKEIRSGWANPQYGVCIDEEVGRMIDAFERLDEHLKSKGNSPSDWQ